MVPMMALNASWEYLLEGINSLPGTSPNQLPLSMTEPVTKGLAPHGQDPRGAFRKDEPPRRGHCVTAPKQPRSKSWKEIEKHEVKIKMKTVSGKEDATYVPNGPQRPTTKSHHGDPSQRGPNGTDEGSAARNGCESNA